MTDRALRSDAERNRRHLLASARELMARDGLGVSYEQIARAAGMGMGTIYRRFPDRDDLVDALFAEHIDTVVRLAEEAAEDDDALAGITRFLTRQLELEAEDRALGELLRAGGQSSHLVQEGRERITPRATALVERAVRAGQLPPATTAGDLVLVHLMVGGVMDATRGLGDGLWRRALATALAGLRCAEHPDPPLDDTMIDRLYDAPPGDEHP